MNMKASRLNVLLLGSCVVRDPFEREEQRGGKDFHVAAFYSLTSMASMGALPMHGIDVSSISDAWRRRMVEADLRKDSLVDLARIDIDLVLVDFTVDTFTLLLTEDGRGLTVSNVLLRNQHLLEGLPRERYDFMHPAYREYWAAGWKKTVEILRNAHRLNRLLVNRVYFATIDDAGSCFSDKRRRIDAANAFLDWAYARAAEDLPPSQFIDYRRDAFVAKCGHKWGRYYAHYVDEIEESCIASVKSYCESSITQCRSP